jgi:Replication initiation factor
MTGVGLGWLQGTVRRKAPERVVELLRGAVGAEPEGRGGGTHWYAESVRVGPHALVAWEPRRRPEAAETYFEVHQTGLDELGGARSLRLAADLHEAGARYTRVDGYYDDHARHAEPPTVAEAFRRGLAVSHIRRVRELREYVLAKGKEDAWPDGATTYLGSPTSEAMVRIYDKAAESGRVDAGVRWEVQMRRRRAEVFAAGAVTAGEGLGAYVLGCIRGLVDFRVRAGGVHGDRAPLVDWWAAIVADAARVPLNGPAKVDTLEKRAVWLEKQAAPSLALLWIAYGSDWLNELLLSGEERLTEEQRRLLGGRRGAGGEP